MLRPVSLSLGTLLALNARALDAIEEEDFGDEIALTGADKWTFPIGRYRSEGIAAEPLEDGRVWITLLSDGTYRWESELDPGLDDFVEQGEYALTRSRGKTYLRLTPEGGEAARYEYFRNAESLSLNMSGAWVKFARVERTLRSA